MRFIRLLLTMVGLTAVFVGAAILIWKEVSSPPNPCSLESIWTGSAPYWDRAQARVRSLKLEGKSQEEVLECFGEPRWFAVDDPDHWMFEVVGFGLMNDAIALSVKFSEEGTVRSVKLWEMGSYWPRVENAKAG